VKQPHVLPKETAVSVKFYIFDPQSDPTFTTNGSDINYPWGNHSQWYNVHYDVLPNGASITDYHTTALGACPPNRTICRMIGLIGKMPLMPEANYTATVPLYDDNRLATWVKIAFEMAPLPEVFVVLDRTDSSGNKANSPHPPGPADKWLDL